MKTRLGFVTVFHQKRNRGFFMRKSFLSTVAAGVISGLVVAVIMSRLNASHQTEGHIYA